MDPDNGIDFHWHDYSCKFNNYFICEQEIETRYIKLLKYMGKMVPPLCQCFDPFYFLSNSVISVLFSTVLRGEGLNTASVLFCINHLFIR